MNSMGRFEPVQIEPLRSSKKRGLRVEFILKGRWVRSDGATSETNGQSEIARLVYPRRVDTRVAENDEVGGRNRERLVGFLSRQSEVRVEAVEVLGV